MVIVHFQEFVDSSRRGIVERHVHCLQSPMHFVESATQSGSSRARSSMNFSKQFQLLFAKTLPLNLCHSDVIVL